MRQKQTRAVVAADLPACMARNDGRGRIVELVQLCKNWAHWPDRREAMIAVPPKRLRWWHRWTPRRYDLARIAAVVHALCDRDGVDIPDWVWEHRADQPLTFQGREASPSQWQTYLQGIAPPACAYHNVWFDNASIEDCRVHGFTGAEDLLLLRPGSQPAAVAAAAAAAAAE